MFAKVMSLTRSTNFLVLLVGSYETQLYPESLRETGAEDITIFP